MNNKLLEEKRYHNLQAEKYSENRMKDFVWEIPEEMFLLKNKYFRNKTVLDMGCGPAISITRVVSEKILSSCKYIGVDISNKMISFAKKNIPHGSFIISDVSKDIHLDKSIDTLLSLGALHHSL